MLGISLGGNRGLLCEDGKSAVAVLVDWLMRVEDWEVLIVLLVGLVDWREDIELIKLGLLGMLCGRLFPIGAGLVVFSMEGLVMDGFAGLAFVQASSDRKG